MVKYLQPRECPECRTQFMARICPSDIKRGGGKYCSQKCQWANSKGNPATYFKSGHIVPQEWCEVVSANFKGKPGWSKGKKMPERSGENHPAWKGGITPINRAIRNSLEMKEWRRHVFQRDDYTCQGCGVRNSKGIGKTIKLNADHELPFSQFPDLRFEILNGRTLCVPCHKKTGTWGTRSYLEYV